MGPVGTDIIGAPSLRRQFAPSAARSGFGTANAAWACASDNSLANRLVSAGLGTRDSSISAKFSPNRMAWQHEEACQGVSLGPISPDEASVAAMLVGRMPSELKVSLLSE